MKLITRQDVEAPLDFAFEQLTDFDQFERMAMRRGAEVDRTDRLKTTGPGMAWRLKFTFRGRERKALIRFVDAEPGSHLIYNFESGSLDGVARIDLLALSARRTRLTVASEVRPRTMAARLVLQSLRLARGRIDRKYAVLGGQLANLIEERWRAGLRS